MSRALSGWGRTPSSVATVAEPEDDEDVARLLAGSTPVIARGLGRSYGDAAQLGGGIVLSNRRLGGISPVSDEGVVTAGAGVSVDELLTAVMDDGWFIPASPGTRQVTLGGAIAADVHGKGHHVEGSFGTHVTRMRLVTPTGVREISPTSDAELFWATTGGMGLTGVVTDLSLRLLPMATSTVLVDTERVGSLSDLMATMRDSDARYDYSVAWVDCVSRGRAAGRSVLERANRSREVGGARGPRPARVRVPVDAPSGLLTAWSVRAFNEFWYRKARVGTGVAKEILGYLHPLDMIGDWNRLYGRRGFVQYQYVVPDDAEDAVLESVDRLARSGVPSFLAVLKRFGPASPGPLSFPMPGWTLALDLPVGPARLPSLLDELDQLVLAAGGRVYLAKDSRLDPATFVAMYPRASKFRDVKARVDPAGVLTSDLARRVGLVGA